MNTLPSHLSYFGLREQPFAPTADPSYFFASREHKSCLFRLWSNIDERHGIAVVLGSYGTGKTTLLRKLLTGMAADPDRYNTAVIGSPLPSWTSLSLLEAIVKQFGIRHSESTFESGMAALQEYLLANRDRINTLIVDDAQNINKRGQIELLRLVQNLETQQHKLLNLVFFGQMEWQAVLDAAPNFQQRVNMAYTLSPLTLEEIRDFIAFRLHRAGGNTERAPRFTPDAVEIIHAYSEGNPREIVTICRNALLFSAQVNAREITPDLLVHTIEKTSTLRVKRRVEATAARSQRPGKRPGNAVVDPIRSVALPLRGQATPDRKDVANRWLMQAQRDKPSR